ncbi:tRNA-splicing endonuclease subunit Sen34-like [Diadema antillarum]|uniref:tRNA-splicing endonuclease subunit Sen34-like n=1 Tax=Diadema antillarum TaxID=105358 RepID=UPI003A8A5C63
MDTETRIINLQLTAGQVYVWLPEDVKVLRQQHHIVGSMVGSIPGAPRQNVQLGLPLQLMPEEVAVLLKYGVARLVTVSMVKPSRDQVKEFKRRRMESVRDQKLIWRQNQVARKHELREVIREGRMRKEERRKEKLCQRETSDENARRDGEVVERTEEGPASQSQCDKECDPVVHAEGVTEARTEQSGRHRGDQQVPDSFREEGEEDGNNVWTPVCVEGAEKEDDCTNGGNMGREDVRLQRGCKDGENGLEPSRHEDRLQMCEGESNGTASKERVSVERQELQRKEQVTGKDINTTARCGEEDGRLCGEMVGRREPSSSTRADEFAIPEALPHPHHARDNHSKEEEGEEEAINIDDIKDGGCSIQLFTAEPPGSDFVFEAPSWMWRFPSNEREELRFQIFLHFWQMGYYLTSGTKFGGDFLAYPGDPLLFHSYFIVVCLPHHKKMSPLELISHGRLGTFVKKTVVLCSMDSAKRVVCTSLQWSGIS